MSTKNAKYRVKNANGEYEVVHLETSASQVKFNDGKTFQDKLDEGTLKGEDGLTTSITLGNTIYSHVDGNITLPSYYTKSEIDNIIGDINKILDIVNGEVI